MDNKTIARELLTAEGSTQDFEKVSQIFAENYIGHIAGAPANMTKAMRVGFRQAFFDGFPDLHHAIDNMIAEGDFVAAHGTAKGTHQKEFQGIPATGKPIDVAWSGFMRFADGKIVEEWVTFDAMGMMQQLGVIPEPAKS